jgi:hypothetical protein
MGEVRGAVVEDAELVANVDYEIEGQPVQYIVHSPRSMRRR